MSIALIRRKQGYFGKEITYVALLGVCTLLNTAKIGDVTLFGTHCTYVCVRGCLRACTSTCVSACIHT